MKFNVCSCEIPVDSCIQDFWINVQWSWSFSHAPLHTSESIHLNFDVKDTGFERTIHEYIGVWFMVHRCTFLLFLNHSSKIHMRLWKVFSPCGINVSTDACIKYTTAMQFLVVCNQLFWSEHCLNFLRFVGFFVGDSLYTTLAFAVVHHEHLLQQQCWCRFSTGISILSDEFIWKYSLLLNCCAFINKIQCLLPTIRSIHSKNLSLPFIRIVIKALVCGTSLLLFSSILHTDWNMWVCLFMFCYLFYYACVCAYIYSFVASTLHFFSPSVEHNEFIMMLNFMVDIYTIFFYFAIWIFVFAEFTICTLFFSRKKRIWPVDIIKTSNSPKLHRYTRTHSSSEFLSFGLCVTHIFLTNRPKMRKNDIQQT